MWYRFVCYLEQTSHTAPLTPALTLDPSISCSLFVIAQKVISFIIKRMQPLFVAHTSRHHGGVTLRELLRCTETQKCLFLSPLLATLTHSLSRKSFPCHSYETPGMGVSPLLQFPLGVSVPLRQTQRHASHFAAVRASSILFGNRSPITSSPRPICFYTKPHRPPEAGQAC